MKDDQEHISVYLPKVIIAGIREVMLDHEQRTGLKLTMSAAMRYLLMDGLNLRKVRQARESKSSSPSNNSI